MSHDVAQAFKTWCEWSFDSVEFWISSQSIEPGGIWFDNIMKSFSDTKICILFVTSENLLSPWLHFEAGAALSILGSARIIPILVDIPPSQLNGALVHFQAI